MARGNKAESEKRGYKSIIKGKTIRRSTRHYNIQKSIIPIIKDIRFKKKKMVTMIQSFFL